MEKKSFLYSFRAVSLGCLIALTAVVSCKKDSGDNPEPTPEPEPEPEFVTRTFALTPQALASKAAVGGTAISWSDGDVVNVFDDQGTALSAKVASDSITVDLATAAATVYVAYPYSADATLSGGVFTTAFPSVQRAVDGSAATDAIVLAGSAAVTGNAVGMSCASAFLKFTVAEEDVMSVRVESLGGEKISGKAQIGQDGTVTLAADADTAVTLTGGLKNGSSYLAAIAPQTISGYKIQVTYSSGDVYEVTVTPPSETGGEGESATTATYTFEAGSVYDCGTLPGFSSASLNQALFVSVDGSGDKSGRNWGNTLSLAQFRDSLNAVANGMRFYLMAGTYALPQSDAGFSFGDFADARAVHVYGGYNPSSKGVDREKRTGTTTITGGGSYPILNVANNGRIDFDGITFTGGSTAANNSGSLVYVNGNNAAASQVTFSNCTITDNKWSSTSSSLIYVYKGIARLDRCTVSGNEGPKFDLAYTKEAGALLYVYRTLVTDNNPTNGGPHYGYIIQNGGTTFIVNSTLRNNRGTTGRKGAIQDQCGMVIANSTIVETGNGTGENGTVLRTTTSRGISFMTNSIILNTNNADGWNSLWVESGSWQSKGYNLLSKCDVKSASLTYTSSDTDVQTTTDALGLTWTSPSFVWSGSFDGFTKTTQAAVEEAIKGFAPSYNGQASGENFLTWAESRGGLAVDQVGNARDGSAIWPGSYEKH